MNKKKQQNFIRKNPLSPCAWAGGAGGGLPLPPKKASPPEKKLLRRRKSRRILTKDVNKTFLPWRQDRHRAGGPSGPRRENAAQRPAHTHHRHPGPPLRPPGANPGTLAGRQPPPAQTRPLTSSTRAQRGTHTSAPVHARPIPATRPPPGIRNTSPRRFRRPPRKNLPHAQDIRAPKAASASLSHQFSFFQPTVFSALAHP